MMDARFTSLFRKLVSNDGLSLRELAEEVVICERCRIDVPVEALAIDGRCRDPQCPLNSRVAA